MRLGESASGNPVRLSSSQRVVSKTDVEKGLSCETAWEKPSAINFHHSEKEIEGQSSSNSYWTHRMRGEAEANAESTEKPVVRLTPAPKYNEDPSMEFEPLRNEGKTANHIIQNVYSKFGEYSHKMDNFLVVAAIWRMLMNDCMWDFV